MNCQTCRQHLQPFLDDELSVKDNVAVLEHVTACGACQDVFNAEKRMWESVRTRFANDTCPTAVADRALASVRAEARRRSGMRSFVVWPAVAAALAAAFFLPRFLDHTDPLSVRPSRQAPPHAPARRAFAAERTHDHSVHGDFLAWAGDRYDELTNDLEPTKVLTAETLKHIEPRSRAVASLDEFEKVVRSETGTMFRIPPSFLEGGRAIGGELLRWDEGWVPQVILEYGDRELALYEISKCHAKHFGCQMQKLITSFHPVESDQVKRVTIAACRGCDAVLVLRETRAWLLLSRHGRDWDDQWMIDRARRLLD